MQACVWLTHTQRDMSLLSYLSFFNNVVRYRKDGSCPLAICYKDPENHVVLNVDK